MGNLSLDAETLFLTADTVDNYCAKQREIINVYYAQIMALENEWQDDETFGGVVEEIRKLRTQVLAVIEEIYNTYPKYFRDKAQQILTRPTFNNGSATPIKVIEELRVPSPNSQYYRDYSRASYGGGYYGGEGYSFQTNGCSSGGVSTSPRKSYSSLPKTDSGYIKSTFAVEGNTSKLNAILQSSFANTPQKVMENVYKTTDKLEFTESKNGCYYAPCGIKSETHKSVIGVDYSSPTISKDIISLVAQHMFYYTDNQTYHELLTALREDGKNPISTDDGKFQEYINIFKEGVYIPDDQEDARLLKKNYKVVARFFVECFIAIVNQDKSVKEEIKRFFPKSYRVAMSIIAGQTDPLILENN